MIGVTVTDIAESRSYTGMLGERMFTIISVSDGQANQVAFHFDSAQAIVDFASAIDTSVRMALDAWTGTHSVATAR